MLMVDLLKKELFFFVVYFFDLRRYIKEFWMVDDSNNILNILNLGDKMRIKKLYCDLLELTSNALLLIRIRSVHFVAFASMIILTHVSETSAIPSRFASPVQFT